MHTANKMLQTRGSFFTYLTACPGRRAHMMYDRDTLFSRFGGRVMDYCDDDATPQHLLP